MELPEFLQPHLIEPDVLLVNKPAGISSFDVIRVLRRHTHIRKMGHAGTLDPLATGLMIIGIQTGTKKLTQYLKLPKTYIATIRLGQATTSGDVEGEIMKSVTDFIPPSAQKIQEIIQGLLGEHEIIPPVYSALKVDGRALYVYARNNTCPIFMPIKHMGVTSAQFIQYEQDAQGYWCITCELAVTSGTYIRSLAEMVGERLGIPATLCALERTVIGDHNTGQALDMSNMVY
jgi:tRNA pseudouridine55 synthase